MKLAKDQSRREKNARANDGADEQQKKIAWAERAV
jgi:hypothetical protein